MMIDAMIRLNHRDGDEWHPMREATDLQHNSAGSDPERKWFGGRIFRCERCATEISVEMPDQPARHPSG